MGKKPVSDRSRRRARERAVAKLGRAREGLAALEPGGAPDRPLPVPGAALVEIEARAMPCARCGAAVQLEEHTAETVGDVRLRVARVACTLCLARRAIWFRIDHPS